MLLVTGGARAGEQLRGDVSGLEGRAAEAGKEVFIEPTSDGRILISLEPSPIWKLLKIDWCGICFETRHANSFSIHHEFSSKKR